MQRVVERVVCVVVCLLVAKPAHAGKALDPKLWLPKKKGVHRLLAGQQTKLSFAELDHGAQLLVKGPGVIVCEAKRNDARGVRIDLELPGFSKDLLNLFAVQRGVTQLNVPEGLQTIDVALWAPEGGGGTAKLGFHSLADTKKGREPPPAIAQPAAAVPPAPIVSDKARALDLPPAVVLVTKAKLRAISGETLSAWALTPRTPLGLKVRGPVVLVFELRRHLRPGSPSSRVVIWRDGHAVASALFEQDAPDTRYAQAPQLELSGAESFEYAVPPGEHAIALRTNDPRGIAVVLRSVR